MPNEIVGPGTHSTGVGASQPNLLIKMVVAASLVKKEQPLCTFLLQVLNVNVLQVERQRTRGDVKENYNNFLCVSLRTGGAVLVEVL